MPKLQRILPILRKALRSGQGPLALAAVAAAAALATTSSSDDTTVSITASAVAEGQALVVMARADTPAATTPVVTRTMQSPFSRASTRQSAPIIDEVSPTMTDSVVAGAGSTATSDATTMTAQDTSAAPAKVELPRLYTIRVAEPSDIDADGSRASASQAPATAKAPTASLQPRRPQAGGAMAPGGANDTGLDDVTAAASTSTVTVYTPAQIRQAYGFAALPATTTANKGVYQGAGQTIVIIDAYHNATTGSDLNAFSTKFGLPGCKLPASTYKNGASASSIVTAASVSDGCVFQTVYVNAAGTATTTAPAVNSGWATEIALDVQWAHAIAPLARIVLVEAASSSGNDILKAMQFASQLNAQVISMSYGASETSQSATLDSYITGNATWVAASGDSGTGVMWPAVSRNVLAVGGTLLTNVSPRAESAWSGSGGGLSKYVRMPTWQGAITVPGNPANTAANASRMYRGVPDVAYDASPYSGFYVVQNGSWYSIGGTSAGAPQWAAFVAVLNGARTYAGKTAYTGTAAQQALYGVGANTANYRSSFLDISAGSNGSCSTCGAIAGYDLVTGLGTPHATGLVTALTSVR